MKKLILCLLFCIFLISLINASEQFNPIFCNDYEFTCCGGKVDSTQTYHITDELSWTCPSEAHKCLVLGVPLNSDNYIWYIGSENCHIEENWLWGQYYDCDDKISSRTEMFPNEEIFLSYTPNKYLNIGKMSGCFCKRFMNNILIDLLLGIITVNSPQPLSNPFSSLSFACIV